MIFKKNNNLTKKSADIFGNSKIIPTFVVRALI